MKEIKQIILDLGGVLLSIDYNAPIHAFTKLGIENFQQLYAKASQSFLFDEFEKGNITTGEFRNEIRKMSEKNISDAEIDLAWNSILGEFPKRKLELLAVLKNRYRLFLLSNTNEIHITSFEKKANEILGEGVFHGYFEKIYYSSYIGMRKPDQDIFQLVINENNLIPEETIFIDDSIQHVKGAEALRIHARHLDLEKEDLEDLLKRNRLI